MRAGAHAHSQRTLTHTRTRTRHAPHHAATGPPTNGASCASYLRDVQSESFLLCHALAILQTAPGPKLCPNVAFCSLRQLRITAWLRPRYGSAAKAEQLAFRSSILVSFVGLSSLGCIAGGLYLVAALRENDKQRFTAYTRTALDTDQTTSTNEEALRSLETRRDGGREGEVVLR